MATELSAPHITIDISDGPDLHPLDNVTMDLTVLASVEV